MSAVKYTKGACAWAPGAIHPIKIDAEPGTGIDINSVLQVSADTVTVGNPYVEGANVSVTVESHGRDGKIIVFKYKPKKDYRRKKGHRQQFSMIKVGEISV